MEENKEKIEQENHIKITVTKEAGEFLAEFAVDRLTHMNSP